MATPADNLDLIVVSLESIQGIISSINSSIQYSSNALNNINASIGILDTTIRFVSNGIYQKIDTLGSNISNAASTRNDEVINLKKTEELLTKIEANTSNIIDKIPSVSGGTTDTTSIEELLSNILNNTNNINNVNTEALLSNILANTNILNNLNTGIKTLDLTTKIAANGLYQQLARVNNNLVGIIQSLSASSSPSITNIESGVNQIASLLSATNTSLSGMPADLTNILLVLNNVHDRLQELFMISSCLINIQANTDHSNTILNSLLSAVQNISFSSSGTILDITPIIIELQNIANLITDLDATLVMVGNNIVSQIQMSGATTVSTGAIENELIYQTALLENISKSLLDIQGVLWSSLRASNMNFNALEDSDCCERLIVEIQKLVNGNNNNRNQNNKGDQASGVGASFNKALAGVTGGIGTAFVSITTELVKFGSQIKAATSKGGFAGFAATMGLIATAAAGLPSAFMSIVSFSKSFVSNLDPALIQQLELAFANLQAVIGVALTPIISAAVTIFSMLADQLKPVMEFLVPSIQKLALTIIDLAVPYIEMWAYALAEMGPVIDNLTGLMQPLAAIIMPLVIAGFRGIATILNVIIGVFNFAIAGVYALIGAFDKAASWLVSWVSKDSAKALDKSAQEAFDNVKKYGDQGMKSFSDAFSDISQKVAPAVKGGGAGMAAKQASYAGITDLGKSMMQAAYGSSKSSVANQQLEQQKRAADGIDKLIGLGLRQDVGNRRQAGVRG
jgi:hypothetical protein